jgi:hypothetical protein
VSRIRKAAKVGRAPLVEEIAHASRKGVRRPGAVQITAA